MGLNPRMLHHNSYLKHTNNTNSNGCGPPENWEKNFRPPPQERNERAFDHKRDHYDQRGGMPSHGQGHGRSSFNPPYCMYHGNDIDHRTQHCQYFWNIRQKWTKTIPTLCHNLHLEKSIT
jgi:hypothetical protein